MSSIRFEGNQEKVSKKFITGSSYNGELNEYGMMSGFGVYTFPNGDVYEGEFRDGEFHGESIMKIKGSIEMRGMFTQGHCENYEIIFEDGLTFQKENWRYCKYPDRRFYNSIKDQIPPVGEGYNTAHSKLGRSIPQGFFDTEDGFFDPVYGYVWSHNQPNKIIRWLSYEEQKTAINHYRGTNEIPIGYQQNIVDENVLAVLELFEDDLGSDSSFLSSTESSSIWKNDSENDIEGGDVPSVQTTMISESDAVLGKIKLPSRESLSTHSMDQSSMKDLLLSNKYFVPIEKSPKKRKVSFAHTDYILNKDSAEIKQSENNEGTFQDSEQDIIFDFPTLQWKLMK